MNGIVKSPGQWLGSFVPRPPFFFSLVTRKSLITKRNCSLGLRLLALEFDVATFGYLSVI